MLGRNRRDQHIWNRIRCSPSPTPSSPATAHSPLLGSRMHSLSRTPPNLQSTPKRPPPTSARSLRLRCLSPPPAEVRPLPSGVPTLTSTTPPLTQAQVPREARHFLSPAMAPAVPSTVIRITSRIRLRKRRLLAHPFAFSPKAADFKTCPSFHPDSCIRTLISAPSVTPSFIVSFHAMVYFPLLSFAMHPLSRTHPSSESREAVFTPRALTPPTDTGMYADSALSSHRLRQALLFQRKWRAPSTLCLTTRAHRSLVGPTES